MIEHRYLVEFARAAGVVGVRRTAGPGDKTAKRRRRRGGWRLLAVTGAVVGIVSFVLLHLLLQAAVDPWRDPVSSYAVHSPGGMLFAAGAGGFAVACAASALPRGVPGAARTLLWASGVMFVLVVVFPTDSGDTLSSLSGQIHRYAAGAAFVGLTLLSLRYRRQVPILAWINVAALVVTTVNTFLPGLADGGDWRGLPQRVLLVSQALTLMVLAGRYRRPLLGKKGAAFHKSKSVDMRISQCEAEPLRCNVHTKLHGVHSIL